ncbi:RidA family protein [Treponema sp. HNW]|uniref:RidA family protein n=1 Tax=Treponema sp. HNW TaxID=3116654 RepID=UPI003D0A4AD0
MNEKVNTSKAPAAIGPYSQGIRSGNFLFTSGQIPLSPETGEVIGTEITEQTKQVLQNLKAVLEAGESSLDSVLKTTCFLSSMADFAAFNKVYSEFFTEKPARSCIAVKDLPKGVLVEVEAIAEVIGG